MRVPVISYLFLPDIFCPLSFQLISYKEGECLDLIRNINSRKAFKLFKSPIHNLALMGLQQPEWCSNKILCSYEPDRQIMSSLVGQLCTKNILLFTHGI